MDKLFPSWQVFKTFVARDLSYGMHADSQRASHAIQVPVSSGEEIDQIFDGISYSKGASVIRMLENYLGREIFSQGVNNYLKKHAYGNATTNDLWDSLSEASGQDIGKLMGEWTLSMGYPSCEIVKESFDVNKGEMTLFLEQSRFLASGDLKPEEDVVVWSVPVGVKTSTGVTQHLLTTKSGQISFPFQPQNDFYKLNSDVSGFYRVCYSPQGLSNLTTALSKNFDLFTVQDRIGIVSDVFAFAISGKISTVEAIETLVGFQKEKSFM